MGLYHKHRPKTLDEIVGQDEAVRTLRGYLKSGTLPRALLLAGGSGTGKTSAARVLRTELKCQKCDWEEIDCPSLDQIVATMRDIQRRRRMSPMKSPCRIFYIDEGHCLPKSPAQQSLLKMLEDELPSVYFILATTEPDKFIRTIRTRCTTIQFKALTQKHLEGLVRDVAGKEGIELSDEVVSKIAESADGSARQALVTLEATAQHPDEEKQLKYIENSDARKATHHFARLMIDGKSKWPDVAKALKEIEEEPETIRRQVLGYASAIILNGKTLPRAVRILSAFAANTFDTGKPGLVLAAFEVFSSK